MVILQRFWDTTRRFVIKMANGDNYYIGSPSVVKILLDEKSAIVTLDKRTLFAVVDIGQVSSLEFPSPEEWEQLHKPSAALLAEM